MIRVNKNYQYLHSRAIITILLLSLVLPFKADMSESAVSETSNLAPELDIG